MTHVFDDPARFRVDTIRGFALAYPDYVEQVPGASGFVQAGGPPEGRVALLIGGGSGHYPSYCGVTGPGFATASVLGEVFTSPSTEQVVQIGRAADAGAGLVLASGNYAGDRINFGLAAQRLRDEGIDVRVVHVTDDVASAPAAERHERRGIAGTFAVYKVGGASAARGDALDTVESVMRRANDRTVSFGVAFDGCTVPGGAEPLFHVPAGRIDFGLGIHGEPGISEEEALPAPVLARRLLEPLLAERPAGASRAAVLLNGLGATKYEELFVLWSFLLPLIEEAGIAAVRPEVGEFVTSLDMAGCSLSITWLDEELEELWLAPADTPAFRRGRTMEQVPRRSQKRGSDGEREHVAESSAESQDAARAILGILRVLRETAIAHEEELARIDAIAGDGDHGSGMHRGLDAAVAAAEACGDVGVRTLLTAAGTAFADQAGGTSGVLWGAMLTAIGLSLGDVDRPTPERVVSAIRRGAERITELGGAQRGDKTMLDALLPFVDALTTGTEDAPSDGARFRSAWRVAAETATRAAAETASLRPRVGRARPLAARSLGHPDAGATSMALLLTAAGTALGDDTPQEEE